MSFNAGGLTAGLNPQNSLPSRERRTSRGRKKYPRKHTLSRPRHAMGRGLQAVLDYLARYVFWRGRDSHRVGCSASHQPVEWPAVESIRCHCERRQRVGGRAADWMNPAFTQNTTLDHADRRTVTDIWLLRQMAVLFSRVLHFAALRPIT